MDFELLNQKLQKARKEHKCDLCGEIIHKGETCYRQKYHCKDGFYELCTHPKCLEVAGEYYWAVDCDGWETDDVSDWVGTKLWEAGVDTDDMNSLKEIVDFYYDNFIASQKKEE